MAPEFINAMMLSVIGALIAALGTIVYAAWKSISGNLKELDSKLDVFSLDMLRQLNHIDNRVTIVEVRSKK